MALNAGVMCVYRRCVGEMRRAVVWWSVDDGGASVADGRWTTSLDLASSHSLNRQPTVCIHSHCSLLTIYRTHSPSHTHTHTPYGMSSRNSVTLTTSSLAHTLR